jgi:hypothetical protein
VRQAKDDAAIYAGEFKPHHLYTCCALTADIFLAQDSCRFASHSIPKHDSVVTPAALIADPDSAPLVTISAAITGPLITGVIADSDSAARYRIRLRIVQVTRAALAELLHVPLCHILPVG